MFFVSSFYSFSPVASPEELKALLVQLSEASTLRGLVILAKEGINATLSGNESDVRSAISLIGDHLDLGDTLFKESCCEEPPFGKFVVKIRDEIVTTGIQQKAVEGDRSLSPSEWDEMLRSDEEVVVVDTRNSYEVDIGRFKGAIDPRLENFRDFASYAASGVLPRDKKLLLYCTGGIRCEKAVQTMIDAGYENVFQLRGGILKYLEEFPHRQFEGECFVFDDRVAVQQNLQPTRTYVFCPLCGTPASSNVTCFACGAESKICRECQEAKRFFCSLRCQNCGDQHKAPREEI